MRDIDYEKYFEKSEKEPSGLEALKRLFIKIKHYDSLDEKVMLENDYSTIEKELKRKDNLVSICENLAKLVGLKEKDYAELETIITKKIKAFEIIRKRLGSFILTVIEDDLRTSKEERDLLKEALFNEEES